MDLNGFNFERLGATRFAEFQNKYEMTHTHTHTNLPKLLSTGLMIYESAYESIQSVQAPGMKAPKHPSRKCEQNTVRYSKFISPAHDMGIGVRWEKRRPLRTSAIRTTWNKRGQCTTAKFFQLVAHETCVHVRVCQGMSPTQQSSGHLLLRVSPVCSVQGP